ncbi:U6 snRNA-associated Sm-like protein LSm3, putative [Plasmodium gallinaceum]|uniref:U6 snRNA-associated Sm-like protein LSm3, putative n=1 Tax=Plasmodium gallinaceum TaxID=5849 RepID=A0A1J1GQ49_PLAGA|nr:U6 snRNA-associated Sm-like protein LSm3, putative [Plasmodium gallinaceum]CRG93423.1 U6 snRNA-associated Sm-like protein LSm3, putative [Plasmodium gallinaceum]
MEKITLIQNPLDFIRLNMEEKIFLKCKGDREIIGKLDAYDNHLNMILSNVRETYKYSVKENDQECIKKMERNLDMVFVRGDSIILVSSALK